MGLPMRGVNLLVICTVFWALAVVAVGLRIWSRNIKRQRIVWNDWAIYIALVFASSCAISNIVAVSAGGIGNHTIDVPIAQQKVSLKVYTVVWLLQAFANTFVRLSFLDFLYRVFSVHTWFVRSIWVVTACSVAYLVGCFITFFALCRPMAAQWNPMLAKTAHCGDRYLPFLLSAIFNLILDFSIILLPMPLVWRLKTTTERKIALSVVFGFGAVVCAMTILRTIAVVQFNPMSAKLDFTYTVFADALWSSLEPSLGVVNACLPLMPPVIQKLVGSGLRNPFSVFSNKSQRTSDSEEKLRDSTTVGSSSYRNSVPASKLSEEASDASSANEV